MSKYFYRIFTIIDLHFGAMQPCSSGLGMTLEASDFRSVRRLVAYSSRGFIQSLNFKLLACLLSIAISKLESSLKIKLSVKPRLN